MGSKTRVSLSVSKDLLRQFDDMALGIGHPTRSKAISEAMREFVSKRKWETAGNVDTSGVLILTYDHHARDINRAITELQHDFPDVVTATMHVHLSRDACLEVIAFRGKAQRVRNLAKMLESQKGVMDLETVTAPV